MKRRAALTLSLLLAAGNARALEHTNVSTARLLEADKEAANWLTYGRTYNETRYSPLKQINASNLHDLGLAWSYELDDERGLEATPLVVDGVMYVTGTWSRVYALDAASGALLWRYDPKVPREHGVRACCDVVNRGVAVWEDKVYVGTLDGFLVAIDRRGGNEVWRTLTVDPSKDYTITGAPRVVKGMVLIGNGGAEYGVRGYLSAYDGKTGALRWRFYTVPGDPAEGFENKAMEAAAKTWKGQWWKYGGGGTVWDSFVFDPALNLVYIGVGNGGPWNPQIRSPGGGDNLYLSSIVAVNADSGEYAWHYQETPEDSWDFTATQQIMLADIEWKGAARKVLMQAPKNGFFFILDRVTGEFLSAEPYTKVNWAKGYDAGGRPIVVSEARYREKDFQVTPSALGGHNWQPMSYSPDTGLVYIPAIRSSMPFKQPDDWVFRPHHMNTGVDVPISPMISPLFMQILKDKVIGGELVAWDPRQQRRAWAYQHERTWNGGTLATASKLVFQGTADRKLLAFDAETGKPLWQYDTQLGIIAAPMTYAVNGEQYIAVPAKWGGVVPLALGMEPRPGLGKGRLLAFKLGGKEVLPPATDPSSARTPPPAMTITDEASLKRGEHLFTQACAPCHGRDVVGGGTVPDLRRPVMPLEAFKRVVLDGALKDSGMVGFRDLLDEQDTEKVYNYVLKQAHADYDEHEKLKDGGIFVRMKLWWYDKLSSVLAWMTKKS